MTRQPCEDELASDSLEYDSDQERHAAYTQGLGQTNVRKQHAASQQHLLRSYRCKADWERARKTKCFSNTVLSARCDNANWQRQFASPTEPAGWAEHELRWQSLEEGKTFISTWADIPWPPCSQDLGATLMRHVNPMHNQQQQSSVVRGSCLAESHKQQQQQHKQAFQAAMLRWHPDKFACRLSKLTVSEQAAAMQQLQHIVNSITACNNSHSRG